jgi:hypothetical protein
LRFLLDSNNQEIIVTQLSTTDCHDKELLPDLLANVDETLGNIAGDRGDDSYNSFNAIKDKEEIRSLLLVKMQKLNSIVNHH